MAGSEPRRFERTLAAARQGDETAWAALYAAHAPAILGYARARGAAEPEDVLGDTFEHAARSLHQFSGGESELRAWLLRIAHNRLVDEARRRARNPLGASGERPRSGTAMGAQSTRLDTEPLAPGADQEALERLGAEELRELIGALSPDQQAVFLLRVLGDLSVAQVADVLGKRVGAVKALQHRASASLARQLRRRGLAPPEESRDDP